MNDPSAADSVLIVFSIGTCDKISRTSSFVILPSRSKSYLKNKQQFKISNLNLHLKSKFHFGIQITNKNRTKVINK